MADSSRRAPQIKNKNAAAIQISAEQLLREANETQEAPAKAPEQTITDADELAEYRLRKRKDFEDQLRRNRLNIGTWMRYAAWEDGQGELARARSIYERALDVEPQNVTLYLKYTEMEMKHRNVNLARNLFDRVVTLLPRVDQFWYKYAYMEEMLGNIAGTRAIFERWMKWEPDESAWSAYIKFEIRYEEMGRARALYERFVHIHPAAKNWLKWVQFEEENGNLDKVRGIFTTAIGALGDDFMDQKLYVAFAKFEIRAKEYERARVIFKYALERLPRAKSQSLYNQYTQFEKQYGEHDGVEEVILAKRRLQYQEEVAKNPHNYDAWFDYTRLEENAGRPELIRDTYERAIAEFPPVNEKRLWRRYIYLWLHYALWEELETQDYERARQIYAECLDLIPHRQFTFGKVWLQYAYFEVRRLNLTAARRALGRAIGMCPKDKLFKGYIELELHLREFDRVRTLYGKYLEFNPANCSTWIEYAKLERMLGETERCRALLDIAVSQPVLDMPEVLWKAYIDFEFEHADSTTDRVRNLYERLLDRTDHIKVWLSFAQTEAALPSLPASTSTPAPSPVERARAVYERAYEHLCQRQLKPERVVLLEAWRDFEEERGSEESARRIRARMPKIVKRRRQVGDDSNACEEYFDYLFPDDQTKKPNLKLLAMAQQWKSKIQQASKEDA
ncbi:NineTeen Complex (NTC) component [Dimargaris cristalligena]|uniref:Cell cycle control protein n=1 Tax=Dimargaris cristalligena TaxID=215637 RepID=A0A4V1J4V8_9FUNG|nr:NineTeen Complex (NTC) component [Dimargaris cristalligena]RKP36909.1 cell cycle control protein [Dimargaris cristalligena]|eukprot:RKP36909.1 cell cycle control protein [Dimargaris cristalligena]